LPLLSHGGGLHPQADAPAAWSAMRHIGDDTAKRKGRLGIVGDAFALLVDNEKKPQIKQEGGGEQREP